VEPPHDYVHETSSSAVHHCDYLNRRDDHALCGVTLTNPVRLDPSIRPESVCPDCEAKLADYHLMWWRQRAEAASAELDELRVKYRELAEHVDRRRPAQVMEDRIRENDEAPQGASTPEQGETTSASLLDQVRRELLELCGRADEAVPFWRVKKAMDAFSDKLSSDERVLLAEEIGAGGSVIRWCTTEIERLGLQVTNNPVSGDANDMMDAWTEDLYPTPKKTKWRRGRSRSHNGS
jgi:hypothetical protein